MQQIRKEKNLGSNLSYIFTFFQSAHLQIRQFSSLLRILINSNLILIEEKKKVYTLLISWIILFQKMNSHNICKTVNLLSFIVFHYYVVWLHDSGLPLPVWSIVFIWCVAQYMHQFMLYLRIWVRKWNRLKKEKWWSLKRIGTFFRWPST